MIKKIIFLFLITLYCVGISCNSSQGKNEEYVIKKPINSSLIAQDISIIVLGTLQDGGSPHIGCKKNCCKLPQSELKKQVVSLGLVDVINKKSYLFEATPDIVQQMEALQNYADFTSDNNIDGIFLTHAHIGHYTGLMYLGKEAMNSYLLPVYGMPKMNEFLENNGPWGQLITNQNIKLQKLTTDTIVKLSPQLSVQPFLVPHRDEYSETIGYIIYGTTKKALFIPDIDKWEKWNKNIVEEVKKVDYAFIDATFYDIDEIGNRNISTIPHPLVSETIQLFDTVSISEKNKIYFIHLNHTNSLLNEENVQTISLTKKGFHIAQQYDIFKL